MATLKEFNEMFGRTFPLAVVKTAYGYVLQGHDPGPSLSTAAILYAAKLEKQPLNYIGYACISSVSEVTVYTLKTATQSGLRRISPFSMKESKGLTIATLGENCSCDVAAVFGNQPNSVLGCYTHRNRYAAVIRLNYGTDAKLPADILKRLQNLADVLAKNVLAWWPEYLKKKEALRNFYIEKYKREPRFFKSDKFDFFNEQVLRFVPNVNDGYESGSSFYNADKSVTISDYLANFSKQSGLRLSIEGIDIYGL
jgi:hypothetical protein